MTDLQAIADRVEIEALADEFTNGSVAASAEKIAGSGTSTSG
jgi:hypothetical protein